jgi:hypothetical protein
VAVSMTVEMKGATEALATLRRIDPKLRTEATRQLKAAGASLLEPGKDKYPTDPPLSGFVHGRLAYNGAKARRGVQIRVGGRTPKGASQRPVVTIVQSNAGAAVFSLAGIRTQGSTPQGRAFVAGLKDDSGKPQRGVWAARNQIAAVGLREVEQAVNDVMQRASRELKAQG